MSKRPHKISKSAVQSWLASRTLSFASSSGAGGSTKDFSVRLAGGFVVSAAGEPVYDGTDLDKAIKAYNEAD